MRGVAPPGHRDHRLGAVEGDDAAVAEVLGDERHRDTVPAAHLEHAVGGLDVEHVDRPDQPLRRPLCHLAAMIARPAGTLPSWDAWTSSTSR
jgi:hypothetical protein